MTWFLRQWETQSVKRVLIVSLSHRPIFLLSHGSTRAPVNIRVFLFHHVLDRTKMHKSIAYLLKYPNMKSLWKLRPWFNFEILINMKNWSILWDLVTVSLRYRKLSKFANFLPKFMTILNSIKIFWSPYCRPYHRVYCTSTTNPFESIFVNKRKRKECCCFSKNKHKSFITGCS